MTNGGLLAPVARNRRPSGILYQVHRRKSRPNRLTAGRWGSGWELRPGWDSNPHPPISQMGALSIRLPGRSIGIIPLSFETTWTHSAFESDPFDRPKKIAGLLHPIKKTPLPDNNFSYGPMTPDLRFSPAPLGHRVKKSDSRGITQYLIDNTGNTLAELDQTNNVRRSFTHSLNIDDPLSITDEFGHTYFMLPDGLGSVSMLVDLEGNPVQLYNYDPFGKPNVIAEDKNVLKFTSRDFDHDTQLQYHRARYYLSEIGRWLTKDPIFQATVAQAEIRQSMRNPERLNRCVYANNNPLGGTDSRGLKLVIHGSPSDKKAFVQLLSNTGGVIVTETNGTIASCGPPASLAGATIFDLLRAIIDHPKTLDLNVGRNLKFPISGGEAAAIFDSFDFKAIDLADFLNDNVSVNPPAGFPDATTRGEVLAHILGEYGQALRDGKLDVSGQSPEFLKLHTEGGFQAQDNYRAARGQAGKIADMDFFQPIGTFQFLYQPFRRTLFAIQDGDITGVHHDK